MSDVMLFGVLRMPYEMAMRDELSRAQFYQRAQAAADRLEALEAQPVSAGLTDANLHRIWLELTDKHVISKPAFIAAATAISAAQRDSQPGTSADARDAARYRVLRRHTAPSNVAESMMVPRTDIGALESIEDRIDSLCDAAITASKEGS